MTHKYYWKLSFSTQTNLIASKWCTWRSFWCGPFKSGVIPVKSRPDDLWHPYFKAVAGNYKTKRRFSCHGTSRRSLMTAASRKMLCLEKFLQLSDALALSAAKYTWLNITQKILLKFLKNAKGQVEFLLTTQIFQFKQCSSCSTSFSSFSCDSPLQLSCKQYGRMQSSR